MPPKSKPSLFGRKGDTATLAFVPMSMISREIVLELKNDCEVRGIVVEADRFMNITLSGVVSSSLSGQSMRFDEMHIKGTTIRYIFMPNDMDLRKHASEYTKTLANLRKKKGGFLKGRGQVEKES